MLGELVSPPVIPAHGREGQVVVRASQLAKLVMSVSAGFSTEMLCLSVNKVYSDRGRL